MDIAVILALSSAFFFGSGLILSQRGLAYLSPFHGACVSIPTTALMLIALAPLMVDFDHWNGGSIVLFALAGCLFPAVVTLLSFESNRRIGPNLTGALGNLTPLFAVILAVVLLGETPGVQQLIGLATIVIGATALVVGPRGEGGRIVGWTLALPLAAALIRGLVQPLVKLGFAAWPDPLAAAAIGYIVSTAVVFSVRMVTDRRAPLAIKMQGWWWFVVIGVCNGLAVFIMYAALANGPVTMVAPLVASYPLVTLALSRFFVETREVTPKIVISVIIMVVGVALLLRA